MCLLRSNSPILLAGALLICLLFSCKHEPILPEKEDYKGYPEAIGKLIIPHCTNAGCHNEKSKEAAAGLSLESWQSLMQGGRNNSAAIPYSPQKSLLFLFTNTFEELGPSVSPTMPYNAATFGKEAVTVLRNWLHIGAPSNQGEIAFSTDTKRSKIYVLNSLCDEVTVFDRDSRLITRYIKAGANGKEGFPEILRVAPDGHKWYVLFASGEFMQFNAANDFRTAQLKLGPGIWRSFTITADSKSAYLANWSGNSDFSGGSLVRVDLESMRVSNRIEQPEDSLYFPYGPELARNGELLLMSCYTGNFLYKIDLHDPAAPVIRKVVIEPSAPQRFDHPDLRPKNICLLPGDSTYMLICERSNELRFFHLDSDRLLQTLSLGELPQEIVISKKKPYAFISCTEDREVAGEGKGSVFVIDYTSMKVIKKIYAGYQSKGLAIDEDMGLVYVANRNADPAGADTPHHYTDCDGNNGYLTIIDMETLERLKGFKAEVSVDPYSVALRP